MSRREPRISLAPFVWGGLFLFCGIVLLLQVSGVLPWGLWGTLWKFWPVLIIIVGLSFLIPRRQAWLMAVIVLAVIGAGVAIILAGNRPGLSGDVVNAESYTVPLGDIQQADVTIDFSAGDVVVEEIRGAGSPNLIEASPEVRNRRSTMEGAFHKTGDTGVLSLKAVNQEFWGGSGIHWTLDFTPQVPLNLTLKVSAARVDVDLQKLKVNRLQLDMDVSSGALLLPASGGTTTVKIHADVSNLDITIPAGVATRIEADTSVSVLEIDQQRFPKQGGYYVSPDFDNSPNRITLYIVCDVGRITVK